MTDTKPKRWKRRELTPMRSETHWADTRANAIEAKAKAEVEFDHLRSTVRKAVKSGRLSEAGERAVWDELAVAIRQIGDRM